MSRRPQTPAPVVTRGVLSPDDDLVLAERRQEALHMLSGGGAGFAWTSLDSPITTYGAYIGDEKLYENVAGSISA